MVTVAYILLVIPYFVQGTIAKSQDPLVAEGVVPDYFYDYYYPTDYGKPTVTYGSDYYSQYTDYAYNDYSYYQYYDDYRLGTVYDDDTYVHEYGDYFGYGDRNNPLDTALGVYEEAGVSGQVPWVYIIVPVLQVDLYYVDDEKKGIENIDFQPIETFLFELGDFGMGHFELGDFGFGELDLTADHLYDYGAGYDYAYEDYPIYGHYPQGSKPHLYDTAAQLENDTTIDYPAGDYQPLWVDWIFMVPPGEEADPVVR